MDFTRLLDNFPEPSHRYFYIEEARNCVFELLVVNADNQEGVRQLILYSHWSSDIVKEIKELSMFVTSKEEAVEQLRRSFLANHDLHISTVYPFPRYWYWMMLNDGVPKEAAIAVIKKHTIDKLYNKVGKAVLLVAHKTVEKSNATATSISELVDDKSLYPVIGWFSDNEHIDRLSVGDLIFCSNEVKELNFSPDDLFACTTTI